MYFTGISVPSTDFGRVKTDSISCQLQFMLKAFSLTQTLERKRLFEVVNYVGYNSGSAPLNGKGIRNKDLLSKVTLYLA